MPAKSPVSPLQHRSSAAHSFHNPAGFVDTDSSSHILGLEVVARSSSVAARPLDNSSGLRPDCSPFLQFLEKIEGTEERRCLL